MMFATVRLALSIALVGALAPFAVAGPVKVERVVYLMGTRATLVVEAPDRSLALHRLESLVGSLEQTEAELSTWRDDSVLSRLGRHPVGEPFPLSPFVCGLWADLLTWHHDTGGAFDPAIGAWRDAWGLRSGGRVPSAGERRTAASRSGLHRLSFDLAACRVTREAPVALDAGGFGKGAALARLPAAASNEAWLVDLGGQVAVSGSPSAGGWNVALAHPVRRSQPILEVTVDHGSLATSGGSERSYEVEGQTVAHILDPRSGESLARRGSVTVWHLDPLAADALSTALYVMGPADGLSYANRRGLAALFLEPSAESGHLRTSPSRAFSRRFGVVPHE